MIFLVVVEHIQENRTINCILSILIATYSASVALRARWAVVATLYVIVMGIQPFPVHPNAEVVRNLIEWNMMIVITACLGQVQRRSRRRAARLEHALSLLDDAHKQLAEDAVAVAVERNRIAREMHDIVAHRLSVIAVRAGVARALLPTDPA
ncbi:histidine kinase dimerization/phosphoacceptor domain-containing protein [Lentzea sp. NPDC005914]|uniref:histidine kinase dimerization/phosphoacceptor domain-containing protein n=1 Tax=Lentzea sp. NPDC005914 TaxID=3154572 RepID=UPI0033DDC941